MDSSSNSKVTVEYHDPSGLYSLISQDIVARLPLRNLSWKSQTRPLREIRSLYLDFIPDNDTKNGLDAPTTRPVPEWTSSFDIVRGGGEQRDNVVKERKHQIPGLETSPYLKVYLLRCDDKATYKEAERSKLREWIKDSTVSKSKGRGGNHDAFEWLILHVVIPDTLAASEPRWREGSLKESEELRERSKQGSKWPGKSTRTVFDKLRKDFNEPGKSGQDRVAQIRLPLDKVPYDLLPMPAVAETLEETSDEREKAWNDLMNKFKNLILTSFDQRVSQYEIDISEQDSRRSMPGFNFCTFFIHKEGLAKALESVGLIEDALVIYDELSLGFETVLRDIANGRAEGTATTFAPYTADIIDRITNSKHSQPNDSGANGLTSNKFLETTDHLDKAYREKIVRSNISVFDFFCYLFARQKALILRLANAKAAGNPRDSYGRDDKEDLVLISEVCWRSSSFVHNIARRLRQDLLIYRNQEHPPIQLTDVDVDSLIYSWTYTVAGHVLDETETLALDQALEAMRRETMLNGTISKAKPTEPSDTHPQRTTSLPARNSRITELRGRTSLQSASETDIMSRPSSSGSEGVTFSMQSGVLELLTYRAELVMMQRKMLELLGKQRGWLAGWTMVREKKTSKMTDVDLNGSYDAWPDSHDQVTVQKQLHSTLTSAGLAPALLSEHEYHAAFEHLSDRAMRYYVASTQTKSAEAIMGDLAILKYQQGDFEYANAYFQHILPLYATEAWSLMEAEALNMHAKCLKALGKKEQYLRTMLSLLATVCTKKRERRLPHTSLDVNDNDMIDVDGLLPELVAFSDHLGLEMKLAAEQYFDEVRVHCEVIHHESKDGFELRLSLRHLLSELVALDQVSIRLAHVDDTSQEIWLHDASTPQLKPGVNEFVIGSNTVTFGLYVVDKIILQAKHLKFEQAVHVSLEKPQDDPGITDTSKTSTAARIRGSPSVFLYPHQRAFEAEISLSKDVHVNSTHVMEIKLSSGRNEISSIDLKLRPALAGLRLHLADAVFFDIDGRANDESTAGYIRAGGLEANRTALVKVPYSLEQACEDVLVRLEAEYSTSHGQFLFTVSCRLPARLPLDVEVHDVFHSDALISNFTIRTTSKTPLSITQAQLTPIAAYAVEGPPMLPMPITVFGSQPISLVYRITRKPFKGAMPNQHQNVLRLDVSYYSIGEVLIWTLFKMYSKAIEQSSFASYKRLLLPLFSLRSKYAWSGEDTEMAVLLNEAKIPSFDKLATARDLSAVPEAVRESFVHWLQSWHNDHTTIPLGDQHVPDELRRSIKISVDVPIIDVVHKASLSLVMPAKQLKHSPSILIVGEPVMAHLKIVHTRSWSAKFIFRNDDSENIRDEPLNFVFDVTADAESWLVGGQRRRYFSAKEGVESFFDLMLVPLKVGNHMLPRVHVQAATPNETREEHSNEATLSCETHYESAGQVVQIIRNIRTATAHIPESIIAARPSSRPSTATTSKEAG